MISKIFTVTFFIGATLAKKQSDSNEDLGLFAGFKQGVFLPDEASIEAAGCHVPLEPAAFE